MGLTRRDLLAAIGAGSLTSSGLGAMLGEPPKPVVSVVKIRDGNIDYAVASAIELLGGIRAVTQGRDRILLKPNLVFASPDATTKLPVVSALARMMKAAGKEVQSARARRPRLRSTCTAQRCSAQRSKNCWTGCSGASSNGWGTPIWLRRSEYS